jgi:hypothetical protein
MLLHGGGQIDNVLGTGGLVTVSSSAQNVQITDMAVAATSVIGQNAAAPDGGWSSEDNGTYSVIVIATQVADLEGEFAQAGTLGTFQVSIS